MLGELTANQIEMVLYCEVIGRIGCHANDNTYVVPTTYAYDGQFVYGHTIEAMKGEVYRIKLTKKTGRYEKR